MNRGVIILTKKELKELVKYYQLEKLSIALGSLENTNSIFLNEDELENIMDEIGIVNNNPILNEVKKKISDLFLSFRK
jgi:hypothetical protein